MRLETYIQNRSGLPYRELFDLRTGAVLIAWDPIAGKQVIQRWETDRVGFARPSDEQIDQILRMPEPVDPRLIKAEAGRRIMQVADEITQLNMAATLNAPDGVLQQDRDAYMQWKAWVMSMQNASRDMIAREEKDYQLDGKWPDVPPAVVALAKKF